MKLDDLIADGMMNSLDERLAQYTTNLKKHHFSAAYKIRRYQNIRAASRGAKITNRFIEAKKNAPKREKTCYFERAKMKRDAARLGKKPKTPKDQTKGRSKKQGIE